MWYDWPCVLILNWTVPPWFTLIDVAKPWIVASPAPVTCQSAGRVARLGVLTGDHADHGRPARIHRRRGWCRVQGHENERRHDGDRRRQGDPADTR